MAEEFGELFGLGNQEAQPLDLSTPTPDPLGALHDTGQEEQRAFEEEQQRLRDESSTFDLIGAAWDQNIAPMAIDYIDRKWSHEPDPEFDVDAYLEENKDILPVSDLSEFANVRSKGEADELRSDIIKQTANSALLAAHGKSGLVTQLLVGMVDVDLPATIITGGAFAAGKITMKAMAKAAAGGAISGASTMALSTSVDPLGDTKDIVTGVLFGAGLGTIGGGLAARRANKAIDAARREHSSAIDDAPEAYDEATAPTEQPVFKAARKPGAFDLSEDTGFDGDAPLSGQSIGAGSLLPDELDRTHLNAEQTYLIEEARRMLRESGISDQIDNPDFADTAVGRTAKRLSDALHNGKYMPDWLKTDWDRLASSGSAMEQSAAFNLLESAEGRAVNNRSGAMLQENYGQRIASEAMEHMDSTYNAWGQGRKLNLWARSSDANRNIFDRELLSEMEGRWHGEGSTTKDKAIKELADKLDKQNEIARTILIGRQGERSVFGSEDLQQRAGYVPHTWSGKAIRGVMKRLGITQTRIEEFVSAQFHAKYPNASPEDAAIIGRAVIRRAMNKDDGIDANMLSTLDADGVHILTDVLTDAGLPQNKIDEMVERLRGKQSEQGVQGSSKHRINFDMRASDGELSMMDLIDTNATRLYTRYNRKVAGSAALARKGITGTGDRKAFIDAAMAERRALGLDGGRDQREFLEDVFTYFDAGPIGGGVSPMIARMKRLTNLALLNGMGLTQLQEAGAQISAVGIETWNKHAKLVMKDLAEGGEGSPMMKELKPLMGSLGKEHLLDRPDLMMDEIRDSAHGKTELNNWLDTFDVALGKGQRIQGLVSGFYAVKGMQQKIAATSMADKIMQRIRDGADEAELRDIGIDPRLFKKYLKYVEFEADGTTSKLNLEKWGVEDAEDFVLALHRHTNKVVQKAMAGEESMWMHKTVGSMYMHLKTFPLLAMRKQFIRNGGVSNDAFVGALMMGFGTAALFGAAKTVISGRGEDMTAYSVAQNAFNMGNMTGWFPMLADPAAAIMGHDIGSYGQHGVSTGIIATPPAIPTLNKMARIIGLVNPMSELSHNEKIQVMKTTPLVGNLYGFSAMFNAMKETPAERRAARKAEELSKEAVDAKVPETFNEVSEDDTQDDTAVDEAVSNILGN